MYEVEAVGSYDALLLDSIWPMATCFMMVAWKVLRFSGFGNLGAGASLPSLICFTIRWTLVVETFRNLAIADMGMNHLLLALGS